MRVEERLLSYVVVDTQSDEQSTASPSTEKQLVLAEMLKDELQGLGIENAHVDAYGVVYGKLEANAQGYPAIGLNAHMDTATDLTGTNVRPRIIRAYDGGIIDLNEETADPQQFPILKEHIGDDLIVTDGIRCWGRTKAGIVIIMTALEQMIERQTPHGDIYVAFTPDEEVGRGTEHFDLNKFRRFCLYGRRRCDQ
ncbi:MAG: M20/M25/M40 family metallo-hydrolase [Merdibacter sp.]